MMNKIALQTEQFMLLNLNSIAKPDNAPNKLLDAIGRAAFRVIEDLDLRLLVTSAATGETPLFMSKSRTRAMILGATNNEAACRRMALYWGVIPSLCVPQVGISFEEFMKCASREAVRLGLAAPGDLAAVVTANPICAPEAIANSLEVTRIVSE
jgi:pyruvate kinase